MYIPRLKKKYNEKIVAKLQKEFGYNSPMQVPRLQAIHLNMGFARHKENRKLVENFLNNLTLIAGQKAVPTRAKKAISNFKLRAGMIVGGRATVRGNRMFELFDIIVTLALARVRDFRGLSPKSFDQQHHYTIGIKEQIIFPQINVDKVDKIAGLNITFVTNAKNRESSYALLKELGMPFANMHKTSKKNG
ncbi:MAG: 50S ribosomal protein L5 [Bacteroidota bacterium]